MKGGSEYEINISNKNQATFQEVQISESERVKVIQPKKQSSSCNKCIVKGSISECVINLSILSFGIGLLALPQKVQYLTMVMTPILIIIGGIINYWTFTILTDVSRELKIYKYEDIVLRLFNTYFRYFFIFVVMIGILGSLILYQVIIYKFIGGIINEFFSLGYPNMETLSLESFWGERRIRIAVLFCIAILILLPLCSIKTFSKMRYVSTFGVFSIFIIILIVIIQCPFFFIEKIINEKQKLNIIDFNIGFKKDLKFIQSISTILYCFVCHEGIFPVINSLENPTQQRVNKVFKISMFNNVICFIIITVAGYLTQPKNTPDLILEREKIFKKDYIMTIGLGLFCVALITKICAAYNCFRAIILNIFKFDSNNYPNSINFILTISTLSLTAFIAAMFQNISDYININGSFYGLFISVIMPGLIYIKSNNHSICHIKNILTIFLLLVLSFIGATTIFFTSKKLFLS